MTKDSGSQAGARSVDGASKPPRSRDFLLSAHLPEPTSPIIDKVVVGDEVHILRVEGDRIRKTRTKPSEIKKIEKKKQWLKE